MNTLFDGRSLAQKIEDARRLLEENGYLVRGPVLRKGDVKTSRDLVRYFYHQLMAHNPDAAVAYPDDNREQALAKRLLEARVETGISRERALVECCALIDALFKYEEHLGLPFKVTSMHVLGQDKMAWVTHKLVDLLNGYNQDLEDAAQQLWFEELYNSQEENVPEELVEFANKRLGLDNDGKEKG